MKKSLQLLLLLVLFNTQVSLAETEPNDVWNQANLVALGNTESGTAGFSIEQDWWTVTLPDDGMLTINWTSNNSKLVYCQVFDTLGTVSLGLNYTGTSATLNIDGLAAGTYYFKFFAYFGTDSVNYSFTPSYTAPPVSNDIEPNGTVAQSINLSVNGTTTGHSSYYYNNQRDSIDCYKIDVLQDGELSYTITSHNGKHIYALLYDGNGTTQLAGNYTTTSATYSKNGLAPGAYYIKVFPFFTNDFVPYTLSDTLILPALANDILPNESAATASTLPLNGSVTGHIGYHYNGSRDDTDFYQIQVVENGKLTFTISSDNGQYIYAVLCDGNAITYLAGNYTSGSTSYSKDGLAPGIYYIKVYTYYSYEFTPYSLSNTFLAPVQANDIGTNNIYTSATIWPLNGSITGHIGFRYNGNIDNTDWFEINLPNDGMLSYSITSHNNQNVYAQLFDGNGTSYIVGNYTTGTTNYSADGLAAGIYYLKITTYYTYEFAPYTISNTFTAASLLNDIEPNGTSATALVLPINTSTTGHIGYEYNLLRDQFDFYQISLPEDGKLTYTISVENNQNTFAQLLDYDGSTLLTGSYTTTTATYSLNNLAAGTYFIRINTYYLSEFNSYTLSYTLEPMNFDAELPSNNSFAAEGNLLPANTPKTGHINFYHNLTYDNIDWWQIGYDGTGNMSVIIDVEQNHFNSNYPYYNYALYLDTAAAPVTSGQVHAVTNTINLSGLAINKYYLRITPASGTFGAYQLTASYTERCSTNVSISSTSQQAGCLGTITYGVSNGLAPYSVQLYKDGNPFGVPLIGNNSVSFNNLGLGSYYAKAYSFGASGICDNSSLDHDFVGPVNPTITVTGDTTFCDGGSVNLMSSPAYSYEWSSSSTTQSINATTTGNYFVTVSDAFGCSATSSPVIVTVNSNPSPPNIVPDGSLTFCEGEDVNLSTPVATSYFWSTTETTQSINITNSGNYSVTIYDGNGCSASSSPVTVTVHSNPIAGISGTSTICEGESTTLTASGGGTYLWSTGQTLSSITVSPLVSTAYSVTVTNANNCTASANIPITVNPRPTASISGIITICNGGSTTLTANSGNSYQWSTSETTQSIVVSPVSNTNYTVTVTYPGNCTSSANTTVAVNTSFAATISGTDSVCFGGSALLTASPGNSYSWNTAETTQSISISPITVTTYTVTVTYPGGCISTATHTVTPLTEVLATCSVQSNVSCNGASDGVASITGSGGVPPYTVSGPPITGLSAGTYTYTVIDNFGCSSTCSVTITEPAAIVSSYSVSSCNNYAFPWGGSTSSSGTFNHTYPALNGCDSVVTAQVTIDNSTTSSETVSACGSYIWTVNGQNYITSGTYTHAGVNGAGCPHVSTLNLTISNLNVTATPYGSITCFGGTAPIEISATGGTAPYSNTGFFNQLAGTVTYTVTDVSGCTGTASVTLTEPSKVEGTISTTPANCGFDDGTATVTPTGGTGGYTYLWSNGQTGLTATGLAFGAHSVTITDNSNCSGSVNFIIGGAGGNPDPAWPINGAPGACANLPGVVYSIAPVANASSYSWSLPAGSSGSSTTNSITVNFGPTYAGGFICVTPMNSCGQGTQACLNIPAITVKPAQPGFIIGNANPCGPNLFTYSIPPSTNALIYIWSVSGSGVAILNGQGSSSVQVSIPANFGQGTISVKAQNCIGTTSTRTLALTGIPSHSNALIGPGYVCAGMTGVSYSIGTVNGAGTSYAWTTTGNMTVASSLNGSAVIDFGSGFTTGILSVTTSSLCGSFTRNYTIRSTPYQPGSITGPSRNLCGQTGVTYSIAPIPTATGYNWTVPAGVNITLNTGLSITVDFTPAFTGTGNICVAATNTCGNSVSRCYSVTARPGAPAPIEGPSTVCKTNSVVFTVSPVAGATAYAWSVTGGASIAPSSNSATINFNTASLSQANITMNALNACGASSPSRKTISVNLSCRTMEEERVSISNLEVYPNPAHGFISVNYEVNQKSIYHISVVDLLGKTILRREMMCTEGPNSLNFNLNGIGKGLYLLSIETEGSDKQTVRFVVN